MSRKVANQGAMRLSDSLKSGVFYSIGLRVRERAAASYNALPPRKGYSGSMFFVHYEKIYKIYCESLRKSGLSFKGFKCQLIKSAG